MTIYIQGYGAISYNGIELGIGTISLREHIATEEHVPFTRADYDKIGNRLIAGIPVVGLKKTSARSLSLSPFKRWLQSQKRSLPEIKTRRRGRR